MRSSKLIIISIAQMVMANYGFGGRFHDPTYFEVGLFFTFLAVIIKFIAPLQIFMEKFNLM